MNFKYAVRFDKVVILAFCKREMGSCEKNETESCRCDMNKIIKAVAVLATGMVLTTGTAFAGPHHGWGHRPHCPPPPPPRHHVVHHVHHSGGNAGWVVLGAAAVGAVVGGLIGAAAH